MDQKTEGFSTIIAKDPNLSVGIAAIKALMGIIRNSNYGTLQELRNHLQAGIKEMKSTDHPVAAITSGCELFMRFITLFDFDPESILDCKAKMIERGELFLAKLSEARETVASLAKKFILDDSRILTHSRSRVVLRAMIEAAKENKKFHVYVTTSSEDGAGDKMVGELRAAGITTTRISEAAIGHFMEYVDFIMVGAESIVENGGVVNRIGTYSMAICAKEMNKPFYVLTESFKFSRVYILSQADIPDEYKRTPSMRHAGSEESLVDYTPPIYITLLFTDLGILTPSAVSDELIKLYQ